MEWRVWVTNGSYSVSDSQGILKKSEPVIDNPSVIIYVNKVENRIMFKME